MIIKLDHDIRVGKGRVGVMKRQGMEDLQPLENYISGEVILQARLQQFMNRELPDVQAVFRKGRGTRDQIANIRWIMEKARECQKNIYFCFIDYAKAFDCVDHNKLENSSRWEYQTTLPASWEICIQVKNQQLELDMEQQTGSKSGKEYIKVVYCHPAYLTSMQSTWW